MNSDKIKIIEENIRTFISFLYIHNPFYNSIVNNFTLDFISTKESKIYKIYVIKNTKIQIDIDFAIAIYNENKKILFFYIIHEILHIIFKHSTRMNLDYDKEKWDAATDLAIELSIKADSILSKLLEIPPKKIVVIYEENNVNSAENIYKKIKILKEENNEDIEEGDEEDSFTQLDNHSNWENEEHKLDEEAINEILIKASNSAKFAGKEIPELFEEMIKHILKPSAKLLPYLNRIIQTYKKTSYTYKRGDRRYLYNNLIVPSSIRDIKHFELLFYIDTSLSMSMEDIEKILSEIIYLLQSLKTFKLEIIYSDTSIKKSLIITEKDQINLKELLTISGRGGTDLCELFQKDISDYDVTVIYSDYYISDIDIEGLKNISQKNTVLMAYSEDNVNTEYLNLLGNVFSI
jgi:hypothetical protein